jgi:hypothetical protein
MYTYIYKHTRAYLNTCTPEHNVACGCWGWWKGRINGQKTEGKTGSTDRRWKGREDQRTEDGREDRINGQKTVEDCHKNAHIIMQQYYSNACPSNKDNESRV